ncbi:c-type cytochrome [Bacillus sp. SCS-151]|uniref:c-type cytochrome n=1 Tax=Nanhaiella sioensis TaxID=3115293 RepID=UPI00397CCBCB
MKKLLTGLLLSLSLFLTACGGTDRAQDSDASIDQLDAEELYIGKCSSCHGVNLNDGPRRDISKVGSKMSYEEILDIILKGAKNKKGDMPGELLQGEEAEVVAQWLSEKK